MTGNHFTENNATGKISNTDATYGKGGSLWLACQNWECGYEWINNTCEYGQAKSDGG